jgi:hypothetical protein
LLLLSLLLLHFPPQAAAAAVAPAAAAPKAAPAAKPKAPSLPTDAKGGLEKQLQDAVARAGQMAAEDVIKRGGTQAQANVSHLKLNWTLCMLQT